MKKELRPVHDNVACEVCGRTMLKGEHTETFLAPGGHRHQVCDLCFERAEQHGWIREAVAGDVPTRVPRPEPRRPLRDRLRRRRTAEPAQAEPEPAPEPTAEPEPPTEGPTLEELVPETPPPPRERRSRPKDPRHVRAIPTTAEVKVERAVELFNGSEHQRTVAGLMRTLGTPWVSAAPDVDFPSAVNLVVAWELSWYRFRVDLGDDADPIVLLEKGEEIDQIDGHLREWNAAMDAHGLVVIEAPAER